MEKNLLRSPQIVIGGVLALVAVTACVAFGDDDDDDCSLGTGGGTVFAAGTSLRLAEPPAAPAAQAIPASGGFGTHLASCGG